MYHFASHVRTVQILSYGDTSNAVTLSRPKFSVPVHRRRIYVLLVWCVMTCCLKQAVPDEWSLSCFFNSILDDLAQRKSCQETPDRSVQEPTMTYHLGGSPTKPLRDISALQTRWANYQPELVPIFSQQTPTMTVVFWFWSLVMLNSAIKKHVILLTLCLSRQQVAKVQLCLQKSLRPWPSTPGVRHVISLHCVLSQYPPENDHISYLGKRKIIFNSALGKGYVSSQERRCAVIVVDDHAWVFCTLLWHGNRLGIENAFNLYSSFSRMI